MTMLRCLLPAALAVTMALDARAYDRRSLVPDDAMVVIRVSDASDVVAALTNSPLGSLWADPAVQEFLGRPNLPVMLQAAMSEESGDDEQGKLLMEELKMARDEFVVGFSAGADDEVVFHGAARMAKDDYARSLVLDKRIAELDEPKSIISRESFQGVDIIRITEPATEETEETTTWQAYVNGTVIGATEREWVQKTIVRLKAGAPSEPADKHPSVEVTIHGKRILDLLKEAMAKPPAAPGQPPPFDPAALLDAIGVANLGDLVFGIEFGKTQIDITSRLELGTQRKGILAALDTQPLPAVSLPYSGNDIYFFGVQRVNLLALWQEIPKILGAVNPAMAGMLQMMVAQYGVNPEVDLFAHLDTIYGKAERLVDGAPESLTFFKLKNAAGLAQSLARITAEGAPLRMAMGPAAFEVQDFRDQKLYVINRPEPPASFGVCVAGGHLFIGGIDIVRAAVQSVSAAKPVPNPLTQSAAYKSLMKTVPAGAYAQGFFDWSRLVRSSAAALQGPQLAAMQRALAAGSAAESEVGQEFIDGIRWEKMPNATTIAKHFGPSLSYSSEKNGVFSGRFIIYNAKDAR